MPSAEARVLTARATDYLNRLCEHLSRIGEGRAPGGHGAGVRVEWTGTDGVAEFGAGRCTLRAAPDALTLRIEADDGEGLRRMQDSIGGRLRTFGHREDLTVDWRPASADPSGGRPSNLRETPRSRAGRSRTLPGEPA